MNAQGAPSVSGLKRILHRALMKVRPAPLAVLLKKALGVSRIRIEACGHCYSVDPVSEFGMALLDRGQYEPGMCETLRQYLSPGKTFVDVGANEGFFSVQAASICGASGTVIAIEPQRRLIPVIETNLVINEAKTVRIHNVAVSNESGTSRLHLAPDTNTGGSGLTRHTRYRVATQDVRTLRLEELLDKEGVMQVDLMKMDIEGFEYEAVMGSPKLFRSKRIKAFALEIHPQALAARNKSPKDLECLLSDSGYARSQSFGNAVWVVGT